MKNYLAFLLVVLMCLSMIACGGTTPSDTDNQNAHVEATSAIDVENAIAETPMHIYDDVMENQARAMQNTYIMECSVGSITNEYFESGNLRIHLASEELAKLNKGENVAIICKVTEVIEEKDSWGITYWIEFGDAWLYDGEVPKIEPREHEIFTGLLKGKNNSYEGAWNIQIGDSNYLKLIYFAEGTDLSAFNESYNSGEEITFSVDISSSLTDIPGTFHNAKLIG